MGKNLNTYLEGKRVNCVSYFPSYWILHDIQITFGQKSYLGVRFGLEKDESILKTNCVFTLDSLTPSIPPGWGNLLSKGTSLIPNMNYGKEKKSKFCALWEGFRSNFAPFPKPQSKIWDQQSTLCHVFCHMGILVIAHYQNMETKWG